MRGFRLMCACLAAWVLLAPGAVRAVDEQGGGNAILQELKRFREMGSVLYVAAHPDDENTQLITYLARGRGYRTAYLSLTRGDGGQNVLGPEFGEQLGLIRTQELLAARRIDGGRQFFSRALDFGFSKDYRETLKVWDREQVLSDIVRVIRQFRPDAIVTRFSPEPGGTHGHHTASAVLAVEAFKLAGDAKAFPEQLSQGLTVWQPKRILQNGRGGGGLQIEAGGADPVTGETFARMAARSRAMHKSQGFGNFGAGGGGTGARPESFSLLGGEPAAKDILDGVDTTWRRIAGGEAVAGQVDAIVDKFDVAAPGKSVPAILELRAAVAKLPADDVVVREKQGDLDRVLAACLGLSAAVTTDRAEVVPGEAMKLRSTVTLGAPGVPVKWVAVRFPAGGEAVQVGAELKVGEPASREAERRLPAGTPVSQPYWLREAGTAGMSRVDDPGLIGRPENPPAFPVEHVFDVGGQELVVRGEPTQGESKRRIEVIAPVSLRAESPVALFASGAARKVDVGVSAARPGVHGAVRLDAPSGWKVEPAEQAFSLAAAGERAKVSFTVTPPGPVATGDLAVRAVLGGATFGSDRIEINYAHLPPLLLQPPARVKAVALELAVRGKRVGYLPGAGDSVAEAMRQMGYEVKEIAGEDLTAEGLPGFDAVVVGVRAFNVREDLTAARVQALFDFAEAGGTVIEQYNRPDSKVSKVAPYELHVSQLRVTDENAAITLLAPDHPALNVPNRITAADFEGWVQERGLYYPDRWDEEHFTAILQAGDEGETPLKGGLLVAKHGKGYFVYTPLAWFRQLPAGVPGAYRLFANLVSLGK